jgi:hypothetical protein
MSCYLPMLNRRPGLSDVAHQKATPAASPLASQPRLEGCRPPECSSNTRSANVLAIRNPLTAITRLTLILPIIAAYSHGDSVVRRPSCACQSRGPARGSRLVVESIGTDHRTDAVVPTAQNRVSPLCARQAGRQCNWAGTTQLMIDVTSEGDVNLGHEPAAHSANTS